MDPIILGRSIPIIILSGAGMIWSLGLLIGKRTHIFQNQLLLLASTGLCYRHILTITLAVVYSRATFDDDDYLLHYRLSLAAMFFSYIDASLLWCAAIDVFRTSAPAPERKPVGSYNNNLIATYFAYVYTIAMAVVAVILVVFLSPTDSSEAAINPNPIATSGFLTFGQWAFPILFLIQYHATSSKKFVSTFSMSLWTFFGILTLITTLNTAEQALDLTGYSIYITMWIDWVGNSFFVSVATLYLCFTGPKWVVSRKPHVRLSWSEQFDEPENGLVGRGSVSRIRPAYGGRYDESEDLYSHKVELNN